MEESEGKVRAFSGTISLEKTRTGKVESGRRERPLLLNWALFSGDNREGEG